MYNLILKKIIIQKFIKAFLLSLLLFSFSTSISYSAKEEKKKDCKYCETFETLKDWPVGERPAAFVYEKVKYPEKMFSKTESKESKRMQAAAGKKVFARFVKGKGELNKYQHLMIRDMAYFEAYYNEMLDNKKTKVETLEGLKKGREAMRMSLKISPNASTSEAVMKFWATGKMLTKAYKLNKKKRKKKLKAKIDPEIADRAAILANIKKQIAIAKVNAQRAATIEAQKKIGEVN
jgi:hypothetical protein